MKRKIRSQKGASITFALLLFLVCAVMSSIVIVAATAVGGRFSKLGEMDQRYYAVTSASRLLCSEFGGHSIISLAEKKADATPVVYEFSSYDVDDTDELSEGNLLDESKRTLLLDATEAWMNAYLSGTASGASSTDETIFTRKMMELTVSTTETNACLDCKIDEKLYANGLLEFTVYNTGTQGVYRLKVTFASNTKMYASDSNDESKKIKVSWLLHSVKKDRAGSSV